ncbi:hypothetical protein OG203_17390 [Nocardia sp. NBC_01499]|uniref:hypothetical protein n=1 Tax=Nocardia sp. NBC_01499 TaxID=2903597 RepID=UPI0038666F10
MTAPAQVFAAMPPTPPTSVPSVPAMPTMLVDAPRPPRSSTDGSRIPYVPPFVYATFAGSATQSVTLRPSATATAVAGADGALSAVASALRQWSAPVFGDKGTATARVRVGKGGRVIVAASFRADSRATTGNAVFSAAANLSAAIVPAPTASAAFGTTGVSATTRFGPIAMAATGTGTFSMAVAPPFSPSGMSKGGDQRLTGNWLDITGWYADTASYPGSTVDGDALLAQGTALDVVVSASIPYRIANGFGSPRQAVQLVVNGVVVATGSDATGWSGTMTATATTRIEAGDRVTVQGYSTHRAAVLDGPATQVRIARAW